MGDGRYAVPSSRDETRLYIVDLVGRTCTCPDFQHRRAGTNRGWCKHGIEVQAQAERLELIEKARRCSDEQIANLLPKYADDPMVSGALRVARAERKAEQQLLDVFA